MQLNPISLVKGGIQRHGFYVENSLHPTYLYKSTQYWRVDTPFGDFELVRFTKSYPGDSSIAHIPQDYLDFLKEICQILRLLKDPFKEMKEIEDAPSLADKGWNDGYLG